ncbi:MAG: methyltransferase [Pyrinomonadaceae bacterium]
MQKPSLPRPPLELLDLATGYQRSKALFTFVELRVATLLAYAPQALSHEELARILEVHPLAVDRLLNVCVALGLLERDQKGEGYRNSALAEEFLVEGRPTYLGAQLLNYDRTSYPLWADLTTKLREWRPAKTDDETPPADDQGAESMSAQHNLALLVGSALGASYDFSQHRRMLDLGGGTAAMSIGVCAQHAHLRSTVFDLPLITREASKFIAAAGLADQIKVEGGNFKEDDLPNEFDVALLANLLSVASERTNRQLFERIHRLLPAGGAIILSGWILNDDRTGPLIPLLFCLEDIGWQAADVERTRSRYQSWLADAGFVSLEHRAYCAPTSMIIGRKKL